MKLIVDIPEEIYNIIHESDTCLFDNDEQIVLMGLESIKNSTPLNEYEAENCINREDVLNLITDMHDLCRQDVLQGTYERVLDLPSVYPKCDKLQKIREILSDGSLFQDDVIEKITEVVYEANN